MEVCSVDCTLCVSILSNWFLRWGWRKGSTFSHTGGESIPRYDTLSHTGGSIREMNRSVVGEPCLLTQWYRGTVVVTSLWSLLFCP